MWQSILYIVNDFEGWDERIHEYTFIISSLYVFIDKGDLTETTEVTGGPHVDRQ